MAEEFGGQLIENIDKRLQYNSVSGSASNDILCEPAFIIFIELKR